VGQSPILDFTCDHEQSMEEVQEELHL
jgi:hypothetical protein